MKRRPEPELMDERDQARAYADADFSEPNTLFMDLFTEAFAGFEEGLVVDLGCGPADICVRFVGRYPLARVIAVDGADEMLELAGRTITQAGRQGQIDTLQWRIGAEKLPARLRCAASGVISNSLLHHMSDPSAFWRALQGCAAPGAAVLVMDLLRPANLTAVRGLVESYAADAPDILRRDFHNSLLAGYRPEEVAVQLNDAKLPGLEIRQVSDRHWACW